MATCCLFTAPASAVNWQTSAIEGTDANRDGIRDDVAQFIEQQWSDAGMQFWALETARSAQAYLLSQGNPYALHRAHAFMARARRCLTETKDPRIANMVVNRVLNRQLDTLKRQQVYKEAVDQWIHKVNQTEMPSRPDDRWSAACDGPQDQTGGADYTVRLPSASAPVSRLALPAETDDEALPPPNFFITRAMPLDDATDAGQLAPSGAVAVTPLPAIPVDSQNAHSVENDPAGERTTARTGGWQMYTPRQGNPSARQAIRSKPAATRIKVASKADPKLRVKKLQPGYADATATSHHTQGMTQTAQLAPVRAEPYTPDRASANRSATGHSIDNLPPALQELAPYIRSIEQR